MEPLSVAANMIAVLGAGGIILKTLDQANLIRQAPEIVLALNNEISDLRLIVHETQRLLQENQARNPVGSDTRTFADEVTPILIKGRDKLLELESLIQYDLTAPRTFIGNRPKVRKVAWMLKRTKLKTIKDEIRLLRMNLAVIVGLVTSKSTSRLEFQISQIQVANTTLHGRLNAALPDILRSQARSADLLGNLASSLIAPNGTPSADNSTMLSFEQPKPAIQGNVISGLHIHAIRKLDSCALDCSCACHSRSIWKSPPYLRNFLGLLFTGYTGLPIINPKCDRIGCIQMSQSSIYIRYFFPPWLLSSVMEFYIRISRSYGISQCLRVSNVVETGAQIMLFAVNGETEKLKELLAIRKGSPFDVDLHGQTALQRAITGGHVGTTQLLLDAGSDPHSEDEYHRSPYLDAWRAIMSRRRDHPVVGAFQSMFPDPDLEIYKFTPIHKAVLDMSPVDLNQVIHLCPRETMNQPDGTGMTLLMWAAYRGDLSTLESLLLNGANPNESTDLGVALYYAARAGSYDCIRLLLCHGADPDIRDQFGIAPFCGLIFSGSDDVAILELLKAANTNLYSFFHDGSSALTLAVQYQLPQIASKLIHFGVDIHVCENDGSNSLYMATYYNLHHTIRLLLDRGGDHIGIVQDPFGSYLHLIAHAADLQTLKILTNALTTRDIYYKRQDGMTALDVARDRNGVDSHWHNAFNTFISSVYRSTMIKVVEEDDMGNEVFTDALEQQS